MRRVVFNHKERLAMPAEFPRLPPLNSLRTLEVVARHQNFRLAADELGVTQAAVAQQIRGLEAALGIRLFERLPRGLALTDAGRSYSASIRSALALISEATLTLRPQPSHLTVSVTPTFAAKWLIPRIGLFAEAHPGIDLRILATDRVSHFHTDNIDLAVRYGKPPFGPGLETERLMADQIVAVASPQAITEKGLPGDFMHLQGFLLLHDAHNFWPEFTTLLFHQPTQPAARNMRFNQTALAIEAAIAGQGIALANHAFVKGDIEAGRLVQVFEQALHPQKNFYLVWPRRAQAPPALAATVAWLKAQASA